MKNAYIWAGAVLIAAGVWYMSRKEESPNDELTGLDEGERSASPSTQYPYEIASAPRMDSESTAELLGATADQPWYHDAMGQSLDGAAEAGEEPPIIPEELETIMEAQQ